LTSPVPVNILFLCEAFARFISANVSSQACPALAAPIKRARPLFGISDVASSNVLPMKYRDIAKLRDPFRAFRARVATSFRRKMRHYATCP
jgi:hypothetical protein